MKRIKKTYNGVVPNGKILNSYSTSQNDGYSCDYINEYIDFENIRTKITKSSNVSEVYIFTAYRKGTRCYLNAVLDYYDGVIFTLDNSIKPKYNEIAIGNNYSTSNTKTATITITANSTNITAKVYGTSNPYLSLHLEWEI